MTKLLQDKDRQWRTRPNGATPVFDPGLSALGTDDEAGGAHAPAASQERPGAEPMAATPPSSRNGPRLPLWLWFAAAGLIAGGLAVAAAFSVGWT